MAICLNCGVEIRDKEALVVNWRTYCTKVACIDSAFRPVGEAIKVITKAAFGEAPTKED